MKINSTPEAPVSAVDTRGMGVSLAQTNRLNSLTAATSPEIINWDVETYDDLGFHDNSTNNTRITIPANVSRVLISCQVTTEGKGDNIDFDMVQLLKNGSIATGESGIDWMKDVNTMTPNPSFVVPCAVVEGDYFELEFTTTDPTSSFVDELLSFFDCHVLRT